MRTSGLLRRVFPRSLPLLAGFGLFFAVGSVYTIVRPFGPGPIQPVAFNHAKHIQLGAACTDCHAGARTAAKATLPTLDTCGMCHQAPLTKSAEEQKLLALAAADQPLNWSQLTRIPAHVYFSHRRHTALAGIECNTCHPAMDKLTAPPQKAPRQFTMSTCLDCHRQKGARTDCNDCHR